MLKLIQWVLNRANPLYTTYTIRFYMKSGNVIVAPRVKEYEIKHNGGNVKSYSITWDPNYSTLSRPHALIIDVDQVEAFTVYVER
jgi:hypothetical protein